MEGQTTVYHDGECPLCRLEVRALRRADSHGAIRWVDINDAADELAAAGLSYRQTVDRLHVIDPERALHTGVAGFLAIWSRLPGFRLLVPFVRRTPFLLPVLEAAYRLFARYRLTLTGRR